MGIADIENLKGMDAVQVFQILEGIEEWSRTNNIVPLCNAEEVLSNLIDRVNRRGGQGHGGLTEKAKKTLYGGLT